MDIGLPKLKSDVLVAEKLECSEEADVEDELDACKNDNKGVKE